MGTAYIQRFGLIPADCTGSVGTSAALAAQVSNSTAGSAQGRAVCRIKNTHATQVLYVGKSSAVSSTAHSWALAAGVELNLDGYCGPLYVIGSGAATTYLFLTGDD